MKNALIFFLGFACLATQAGAQSAKPPATPLTLNDMAATLRVQPQADGGSLQRFTLPADLIMHSQSADLADLRLFTSNGAPVPFTLRSREAESAAVSATKMTLKAFPVRESGKSVATGNASVRVESRGDALNVFIDRPAANSTASGATTGITATTSVLLDTRVLEGVVTSIELDIDLPLNQIVPITIEASSNLSSWETIATARSVYRFSDTNAGAGTVEGKGAPALTSIDLAGGVDIKNRYLRIIWPPTTNPIAVRGATLSLESFRRAPIAPPRRSLAAPTTVTTHSQEWLLGSPLRLRTLILTTEQTGTLLPLTVLGRDSDKQPWRRLASTVLFKLDLADAPSGKQIVSKTVSTNAPLALGRVSVRQLKIEALPSSAGIAQNLVSAAIEYDAQEVIAAVKVGEDLLVGVGAVNAQDVALPLQTLVPDASPQRLSAMATAAATEAVKYYPERLVTSGATSPTARKDFILWGALLLGVGVLAAMAWGAVKQLRTAKH